MIDCVDPWLLKMFVCRKFAHWGLIVFYRKKSMKLRQRLVFLISAFVLLSLFVEKRCLGMFRFVCILSLEMARNEIDMCIAMGMVVEKYRATDVCSCNFHRFFH